MDVFPLSDLADRRAASGLAYHEFLRVPDLSLGRGSEGVWVLCSPTFGTGNQPQATGDPARRRWGEWRLPGLSPQPYAVYVDNRDIVWLSDFGANAIVRFDPRSHRFTQIRLPSSSANVRQLLGRAGELWGAESGVDKLVVVRPR